MKPALLKTLAIVLIGGMLSLCGWFLFHGGWEKLIENWTGEYKSRPTPALGALVLGPDGNYWGVTEDKDNKPGYLYRMKVDGSDWKRVHTFLHDASPPAGIYPTGGLVSDGIDSLLGVTYGSVEKTGHGMLYKINAATGVLTILVEFKGIDAPSRGSYPRAVLVNDGMGSFWGSTPGGGINGSGTIFKFHAATGVLTSVAMLPQVPDTRINGIGPKDALVSDGNGYWWGTTADGGAEKLGSVFKVNAATGELTIVVEFTKGKGGTYPMGGLVNDGQGFLWGACNHGGKGGGTIFKVNVATGAFTTVVELGGKGRYPGHSPEMALVSDGHGFLWGSTPHGGGDDKGTLFKVDISSGVLTTVIDFDHGGATHKGNYPRGTLVYDDHGAFLGTTMYGGKKGAGTIFKIDIATGVLTTLVEFGKVGP